MEWTDAEWLAGAHAWIRARLREADARLVGEIEQPHVRSWGTVLRVPTSTGDLWFKASIPALAYEAGVVSLLSARVPELVPPLVEIDRNRGWMLMRDGGTRLRELVHRERDLGRWRDVLPRYGELQLSAAPDVEAFVALGAPDRRLAALPAQLERLVEDLDDLPAKERETYRELAPTIREQCRELAGVGIPESIQHDDLHDGQVFFGEGRYIVLDWGDSCVSHPFFTMSITLEGSLSWGLDDIEGSVDVTPYRDAYLESFTAHASRADLETALAIALRLGWVCRALNVWRLALALPEDERGAWAERVKVRLRMFQGEVPPMVL